MDAITLLKADHDKVEELFKKFKANEDGDNTALFRKIDDELTVHAHIEETIFYPKMRSDGDDELKDMILEGIEEHRQMKMFIREIENLKDDSEKFNPKLKVLVEDTEHHVKEEEEEMFPKVREQFEQDVLDELGAEMEAEKAAYKKAAAAG